MEHLPLPKTRSGTQRLPRVPHICGGTPYDDGGFMTYPLRAGWPMIVQSRNKLNWRHHEMVQPSDDKLLESFLQSWLFFGLLHHVLAPASLYSADDYLVADGDKMYLQTNDLQGKLSSWLSLVRSHETDRKAHVLTELVECLKLAHVALQVSGLPAHSGFDPVIRLGLSALFEAVEAAAIMANPDIDHLNVAPTLGETTIQSMREEGGWCPAEISTAASDFPSLSGRLYLRHLWKPTVGIDHSSCTSEGCTKTQINLATYQPRHSTDDCSCEHVGPSPGAVEACLEQDGFPLLKIDNTGDLEVLPFQPDMAYVALSHVWVDGIGNPHDMSLPRCQVLKLRSLLAGIQEKTFKVGDELQRTAEKELYIWCDSLCCPTKHHTKALGMGTLRDVYAQSSYVLVLDSTLEFFKFAEIDQLEATVRILTSKWSRRLWTYQEAGLTRKLLVQFADGPVDFRDIWDHVRIELDTRIAGRYLYRDAAVGGSVLRTLFTQAPKLTVRNEDKEFALALRGLSHRRASVHTDEPLCIAAVFDLDTKAVSREDLGSRMELVWSLMSQSKRGILETLIFNTLPRLSSTGYRWAPASLQHSVNSLPYTIIPGDRYVKVMITHRGLRVLRPGWRIRLPGPPPRLPNKFSPAMPAEYTLGRFHSSTTGTWFNVMVTKYLLPGDPGSTSPLGLLQDGRKDWHVILESLHDQREPSQERALLVYRECNESGQTVFRSAALLQIATQDPESDVLWEGLFKHGMALRRTWPVCFFAIASGLDVLLSTIVAWFPGLLKRFAVGVLDKVFAFLGKTIVQRIVSRIQTQADLISGRFRVSFFYRRMDQTTPASRSDSEETKAYLMPVFMGRIAEVVEEFAPDHEWYVD